MDVHPARPEEWRDIRSLRLRALADAPGAFSSTLAEALEQTDDAWRRWVGGSPDGTSQMMVATVDGSYVGMAVGAVHKRSGDAHLFAMWVDPAHRGSGVASALVDRVTDWARRKGHSDLTLHVAADNGAAIGLYERCGFRITGEPVDTADCAMAAHQMRRSLD